MSERIADLLIVGAGTAGLSAAAEAKRLGADFLIFESGALGTTCARAACMPVTSLLSLSQRVHQAVFAMEQNLVSGTLKARKQEVWKQARDLRDFFVEFASEKTLRKFSFALVNEAAWFRSRTTLQTQSGVFRARKGIVIATGSQMKVPAAWKPVEHRTASLVNMVLSDRCPEKVAVLGAGAVGLETSEVFTNLGIEVHAFGSRSHFGGLTDPAVKETAIRSLSEKMQLHLDVQHQPLLNGASVEICANGTQVQVDGVVPAFPRVPVLDSLKLENADVPLCEGRVLDVDPLNGKFGNSQIYFVGDAAGTRSTVFDAEWEGATAAQCALLGETKKRPRPPALYICHTDPGIATCGKTFAELSEEEIATGQYSFEELGRARLDQNQVGLIRVYANRRTGKLLGAEMYSPRAEHLAQQVANLIALDFRLNELDKLFFYHPTYEEGLHEALRELRSNCQQMVS